MMLWATMSTVSEMEKIIMMHGGIQWISSTEVTVYYTEDIPKVDIKTQYNYIYIYMLYLGLILLHVDFNESSNSHSLSLKAVSAPIISVGFNARPIYSYIF